MQNTNTVFTIKNLVGPEIYLERLREFGFTKGAQFTITGKTLFGSPVFILINRTTVALRQEELKCIQTY